MLFLWGSFCTVTVKTSNPPTEFEHELFVRRGFLKS
jgi:hypothetical protein